MFLNIVVTYCAFLRHCEKSAQVTYVNVRSQRGLFLFLELRAKSRLKTIAGLGVLGNCFLGESGNVFLKIILQSQSLFRIVFVCTLESRLKTIPIVYSYKNICGINLLANYAS